MKMGKEASQLVAYCFYLNICIAALKALWLPLLWSLSVHAYHGYLGFFLFSRLRRLAGGTGTEMGCFSVDSS